MHPKHHQQSGGNAGDAVKIPFECNELFPHRYEDSLERRDGLREATFDANTDPLYSSDEPTLNFAIGNRTRCKRGLLAL